MIAHGHPRNTFDIDLIIRRTDRAKWADLAREAGYSPYREGPTFLQFNPMSEQFLPLDLMLVSDDVIRLAQVNKLDLDEPDIRGLFLKHGTTELYEKVRRLCRQS